MAYIKLQYKSMSLLRGVSLDVILPSDAMMGTDVPTPYKTLYFLPGYSADSTEIFQYLGIRAQAELKGIAVVLLNGENSFYIDRPELNNNYSQYVREVVDMTRKLLPLSHRREDTYIGGISMGVYGSMLNGLRNRDVFSKIAVLSPAVDAYDIMVEHPIPGFSENMFKNFFQSKENYMSGDTNLKKAYAETKDIPKLFIACGDSDAAVYHAVKDFTDYLTQRKIPHVYKEVKGNHDLDTWEGLLDAQFSFLAGIPEGFSNHLVIV